MYTLYYYEYEIRFEHFCDLFYDDHVFIYYHIHIISVITTLTVDLGHLNPLQTRSPRSVKGTFIKFYFMKSILLLCKYYYNNISHEL